MVDIWRLIFDFVPHLVCAGRVAEVLDLMGKCTPVAVRSEDLRESSPWKPDLVDRVADGWPLMSGYRWIVQKRHDLSTCILVPNIFHITPVVLMSTLLLLGSVT